MEELKLSEAAKLYGLRLSALTLAAQTKKMKTVMRSDKIRGKQVHRLYHYVTHEEVQQFKEQYEERQAQLAEEKKRYTFLQKEPEPLDEMTMKRKQFDLLKDARQLSISAGITVQEAKLCLEV